MDTIIKKFNFCHDDEGIHDKCEQELDNWREKNMDKASFSDSQKALKALEDKFTKVGQVPDYETQGWYQAKDAYNTAMGIVYSLFSDDKLQAKEVQEYFFTYVLSMLEAPGPGTIHMQIIEDMVGDSRFSLIDYIKGLKGEKYKRLLTAVLREVKPTEKVEEEDYYSQYKKYLTLFQSSFFTEELLKSHFKEFIDFEFRLCVECWDKQERTIYILTSVGNNIFDNLVNHFKLYSDIAHIKSLFTRLTVIFKKPQFSKAEEYGVTAVNRYTEKLCENMGSRGLIQELSNEFFDMLFAITQWSYPEDEDQVASMFSKAMYFIRNTEQIAVQKKPEVFKTVRKKYVQGIEEMGLVFLDNEHFPYDVFDKILEPSFGNNKDLQKEWVTLLCPLLNRPSYNNLEVCYQILSGSNFKWKDQPDTAREVFSAISQVRLPPEYDKNADEAKQESFIKMYTSVMEMFLEGLKKSRMLKDYGEQLMILSVTLITMKSDDLYNLVSDMASNCEVNIIASKKTILEVVSRIHDLIDDEDYPWDETTNLQRAVESLLGACLSPVKDAKTYTIEELSAFLAVCKSCQKYECLSPSTGQYASARYEISEVILQHVLRWLVTLNRFDIAEDLVPGILRSFEEEDDILFTSASSHLGTYGEAQSGQVVLGKHLEEIINIYINIRHCGLLRAINGIYPANPKALRPYFRQLIDTYTESGNQECVVWLGQLFHKVSKMQPDLFTDADMKAMVQQAKKDTVNQAMLLQSCSELCKRRPEGMSKCVDIILDTTGWNHLVYHVIIDMAGVLGVHDKKVASKALDFSFQIPSTYQEDYIIYSDLNAIRLIGFKYPDLLNPRRTEVERLTIKTPQGQELKQTILDMIDGKTPKDLQKKLSDQQNELNSLVGRVDQVDETLNQVQTDVTRQGHDLDNVKNEVNEQGQRLDEVEETVDDTVIKLEEIDQKTLSHAPYWSRDVSKLLNPQSDHDWRLLSSRLGYSNDDIQGWAQQTDPCMAMLNEWYATRKTSEATNAIYNQLVEMDRMDVAIIVENAMKNAEAVVEDEDFEYASPPPIFLSYQWGHQEEVKLLKQHLEMAGYDCWLDVGQMGGGDKLFEKIDTGIRAAKVVISCVTEKYAKSPNCNREVNLSVNLNKPMIPLLIEKCTWPPPGSMGPIFSEYLFIRFYQRSGEETTDERYWPKDKFQELLMQLNMFGLPPEEGKINLMYKNWWMPVVEEIEIDKSKTKDGGKVVAVGKQQEELDKKAAHSPDVFISYQWGKQKNIIRLYQRLTSLGYTCWLDIKQMGGGDSLYDKIDRGVRGCRVVLSCVTQKYSLSANCRREVSLADALKKPLVPLLLEDITWPPSGPMNMAMTQLLYIDFTEEEVQWSWEGPKFDELLLKINQNVPAIKEKEENLENDAPEETASPSAPTNDLSHTSAQKAPPSKLPRPSQRPYPSDQQSRPLPSQQRKLDLTTKNVTIPVLVKTSTPQPSPASSTNLNASSYPTSSSQLTPSPQPYHSKKQTNSSRPLPRPSPRTSPRPLRRPLQPTSPSQPRPPPSQQAKMNGTGPGKFNFSHPNPAPRPAAKPAATKNTTKRGSTPSQKPQTKPTTVRNADKDSKPITSSTNEDPKILTKSKSTEEKENEPQSEQPAQNVLSNTKHKEEEEKKEDATEPEPKEEPKEKKKSSTCSLL